MSKQESIPVGCNRPLADHISLNLLEAPCILRSKLNKFEHLQDWELNKFELVTGERAWGPNRGGPGPCTGGDGARALYSGNKRTDRHTPENITFPELHRLVEISSLDS